MSHQLNTPYTEAWYSYKDDCIKVKVYLVKERDGQKYKEGIVLSLSHELFQRICEGCEYPEARLDNDSEFEKFGHIIND